MRVKATGQVERAVTVAELCDLLGVRGEDVERVGDEMGSVSLYVLMLLVFGARRTVPTGLPMDRDGWDK